MRHGMSFEAVSSNFILWQTIQTKEVRLTAEGLASNHTSKHIRSAKEVKKVVVLRTVEDAVPLVLLREDHQADVVLQEEKNKR